MGSRRVGEGAELLPTGASLAGEAPALEALAVRDDPTLVLDNARDVDDAVVIISLPSVDFGAPRSELPFPPSFLLPAACRSIEWA